MSFFDSLMQEHNENDKGLNALLSKMSAEHTVKEEERAQMDAEMLEATQKMKTKHTNISDSTEEKKRKAFKKMLAKLIE